METVQRGYRGIGMEQVYNRAPARGAGRRRTSCRRRSGAGRARRHAGVGGLPERPGAGRPRRRRVHPADGGDHRVGLARAGLHLLPRRGRGPALATRSTPRSSRGACSQMTRHINADWKTHVGATGVTCYTCHRGQPVPAEHLVQRPRAGRTRSGMAGNPAGQNAPAPAVGPGLAALRPVHAVPGRTTSNIRVVVDDGAARRQPAPRSSRPSGPTA